MRIENRVNPAKLPAKPDLDATPDTGASGLIPLAGLSAILIFFGAAVMRRRKEEEVL